MPEISRFLGIIIRMYYDEHSPPHLHGEYAAAKVFLDFQGNILPGDLGSRAALRLVREWIDMHAAELMENWELARSGKDLKKIAPLD
jgi:hypothetical protein